VKAPCGVGDGISSGADSAATASDYMANAVGTSGESSLPRLGGGCTAGVFSCDPSCRSANASTDFGTPAKQQAVTRAKEIEEEASQVSLYIVSR